MQSIPHMLLIAGTGRDSGKTTLACNIIARFSGNYKVVGIKIAPHMHAPDFNGRVIAESASMLVSQETRKDSSKDSSRMLAAGAEKAYFIAVTDNYLEEAFRKLQCTLAGDELLVCESGGLRNFVSPGLFLMLNRVENTEIKPSAEKLRPLADKWISFDNGQFDFDLLDLEITGNCWKFSDQINKKYDIGLSD